MQSGGKIEKKVITQFFFLSGGFPLHRSIRRAKDQPTMALFSLNPLSLYDAIASQIFSDISKYLGSITDKVTNWNKMLDLTSLLFIAGGLVPSSFFFLSFLFLVFRPDS